LKESPFRHQGCELRPAAMEPAESQVTGHPAICAALGGCGLAPSGVFAGCAIRTKARFTFSDGVRRPAVGDACGAVGGEAAPRRPWASTIASPACTPRSACPRGAPRDGRLHAANAVASNEWLSCRWSAHRTGGASRGRRRYRSSSRPPVHPRCTGPRTDSAYRSVSRRWPPASYR
jgi:hypothetical protein